MNRAALLVALVLAVSGCAIDAPERAYASQFAGNTALLPLDVNPRHPPAVLAVQTDPYRLMGLVTLLGDDGLTHIVVIQSPDSVLSTETVRYDTLTFTAERTGISGYGITLRPRGLAYALLREDTILVRHVDEVEALPVADSVRRVAAALQRHAGPATVRRVP